jgi:aryl-alcohol dehydrogenase-like predicted oxidoreductase
MNAPQGERMQLGRTSDTISRVAFGCAAIGGHDYGAVYDEESIEAVCRALDMGIDCFDTADVYGFGHAEEVLGRALEGRRHEAFVATKVGVAFDANGRTRRDLSPRWIGKAVDASLRRLRTDVIDLYQVHWPDPARPLAEVLETMAALQQAGKVRYLGLCNFTPAMVHEAAAVTRFESLQVSYNVADWLDAEVLRPIAEELQLTVLTYNSLAQGLLTGKYSREARFSGTDRRQRSGYFHGGKHETMLEAAARVRAVAARRARTCAQIAVRWILDSWPRSCAVVGMKRAAQAREIGGAFAWTLEASEVEEIREYNDASHVST